MALRLDQAIRTAQRLVKFREELGMEPRDYYLPPTNRKYPSPDEKRAAEAEVLSL